MQIVHQLEQVVISLIAKVLELSVLGMYELILLVRSLKLLDYTNKNYLLNINLYSVFESLKFL